MDFEDDHHRYQSSDEEDFQESLDKAVTLPKPIFLWRDTAAIKPATTTTGSTSTSSSISSPKSCSTLIIGTAFGGSALLHTIKEKTLLGSIILPGIDLKENNADINSPRNANCNIYELNSDPTVIFIPCNYEVKDKDSLNFARAILQNIQATRIIILDTFSPSSYFTGSANVEYNYPWLRLLQTTGSTIVNEIPTLEVPNLVQNLSAALMSYCEVRGMTNTYLLLSLQEFIYGKVLTTSGTLRGLKEGLANLGCPVVANQVDVASAVRLIQDKRVGSNRIRDDRLYA
ncbi:hypothetical protein BX616_009453 [Lobosporangium transversale]|uniref:Uncharacterized protein n=1 Tax=Lobosporangium transversale TaxID=64571 RepID=A0A1Y2GSE7_9FUNG|nr:hypothetical protein BCR41DRAFT_351891 [Lobosporangium transversale]KAF9913850.1 hypothetical protein BX616_009453 [Lobosporangium transversale]ORZ19280.1 hypothetical protein BCR41DRAFT_351891 [Lobosporangium transversale]|eukprot:XP_021882448.1 hypothetical protein BCR41DRAFT_351891 [Lobosporangium transversale]